MNVKIDDEARVSDPEKQRWYSLPKNRPEAAPFLVLCLLISLRDRWFTPGVRNSRISLPPGFGGPSGRVGL